MNTDRLVEDIQCEVLVVGLGPVGEVLAALLAKKGISVVAADQSTDVYPLPRAVGFDSEIMRIFQVLGISDEVEKHTRCPLDYQFLSKDGALLMNIERPAIDKFAWGNFVTFHQPAVEHVLRQLITQWGGQQLLGYKFVRFEQDADRVVAELQSATRTARVSAKYLVGCDGGRSAVRTACNIGLKDLGFEEPWLVVDFLSKDFAGLPDRSVQFCDPARPATYVRMGHQRYRWEFMILDGDNVATIDSDKSIYELLAQRGISRRDPIERRAVYTFHGLIAEQWRKGRVFLAGDAAHQTPPFAGQGMCSGIRDALNLSWKLNGVLRQEETENILDTYEVERRPQVEFIINAAINLGRIVCTIDPEVARKRDARMLSEYRAGSKRRPVTYPPLDAGHFLKGTPGAGELFPQPYVEAGDEIRRLDDVLGEGPWLLTRHPYVPDAEEALPRNLVVASVGDERLHPFSGQLKQWFEEHDASAMLMRPDFYVFGTGAPGELVRAFTNTECVGA